MHTSHCPNVYECDSSIAQKYAHSLRPIFKTPWSPFPKWGPGAQRGGCAPLGPILEMGPRGVQGGSTPPGGPQGPPPHLLINQLLWVNAKSYGVFYQNIWDCYNQHGFYIDSGNEVLV